MHVDAAYGGFFHLTERGRERFRGIERADSITLDPHKGMFLPYGTGSLVVRDGAALRDAHFVGAEYLQDRAPEAELPNWNEYSPELSRDHRGFRVWLPLVLHGVGAFRQALDEKLDLAEHLYAALAEIPADRAPLAAAAVGGAVPAPGRDRRRGPGVPRADQRARACVPVQHDDRGPPHHPRVHREPPHPSRPDRRGDRDHPYGREEADMPEMPEVQALAERVGETVGGATLDGFDLLQFSSLKTVTPRPAEFVGRRLEEVARRGKFLILDYAGRRSDARASLAGRPARHRGAAEVDEAEGLRRPVPLRRPTVAPRQGVREGAEGGRVVARGRRRGAARGARPRGAVRGGVGALPREHGRAPGPHDPAGPADRCRRRTRVLRRRAPPRPALSVRRAREAGHRGTGTARHRPPRDPHRRARGGAAPQRRSPDEARRSLHRPWALGSAVPPLRRRPPSRLLRVPRGHATARTARPAARFWPTGVCRVSSASVRRA